MRTLSCSELPRTDDPRQLFTLDLTIDGAPLHARVELRFLSAPDLWVISIRDHASSLLLVNQIPLICSRGELNDLLLPFRHLRNGAGLGSLFVLRNKNDSSAGDPAKDSLTEFSIIWGDTFRPDESEE